MHIFRIKAVVIPVLAALSAATPLSAPSAAESRSGQSAADASGAPSASGQTASAVAATALYRSTMPDGRIVLGDRPERGARTVEVIGSLPVQDRSTGLRAQQERDYWRQRSEAFAQRQLMRRLSDERERAALAADHEHRARHATLVYGSPVLYRSRALLNYSGLEVSPQYATSPGAAGRNLATSSTGPGFGLGAGLGGVSGGFAGAASGAGSSFIGSGFARTTR